MISVTATSLFYLLSSSSNSSSFSTLTLESVVNFNTLKHHNANEKFLYWGNRSYCPGKHCDSCEGLGHQKSSLRCALEEAMFLQRTLVMPSRMCINPIHNKKGFFMRSIQQAQKKCPSLQLLDYIIVAFLPGFSEEILFHGALLPLFGINWKSALAVAAIFGVLLHLGNGRKYSFATRKIK